MFQTAAWDIILQYYLQYYHSIKYYPLFFFFIFICNILIKIILFYTDCTTFMEKSRILLMTCYLRLPPLEE